MNKTISHGVRLTPTSLLAPLMLLALLVGTASAQGKTGVFRQDFPGGEHLYACVPDGLPTNVPVPLVVALHGSGDTAANFIRVWEATATQNHFICVAPKSLSDTWGVKDYFGVIRAVDWALANCPGVDRHMVLLTGFSAGGHCCVITGTGDPSRFSALAPNSGFECRGVLLQQASRMPICLRCGDRDDMINGLRALEPELRKLKSEPTVQILSGGGHTFRKDDCDAIWQWFNSTARVQLATERLKWATELQGQGAVGDALAWLLVLDGMRVPDSLAANDRTAIDAVRKQATAQIGPALEKWRTSCADDPTVVESLDKLINAYNCIEKSQWTQALKLLPAADDATVDPRLMAVAAALRARVMVDPSRAEEIADEAAGSKPRSELQRAKRELRSRAKRDAGIERLQSIVTDWPGTSYAREAATQLAELGADVPAAPAPAPAAGSPAPLALRPVGFTPVPITIPDALCKELQQTAADSFRQQTQASMNKFMPPYQRVLRDYGIDQMNVALSEAGVMMDPGTRTLCGTYCHPHRGSPTVAPAGQPEGARPEPTTLEGRIDRYIDEPWNTSEAATDKLVAELKAEGWTIEKLENYLLAGRASYGPAPQPAGQTTVVPFDCDHVALSSSYQIYVPPGYTPDRAWPLVFIGHGGNSAMSEARAMETANIYMSWYRDGFGAKQGFIVVVPATTRGWGWEGNSIVTSVIAKVSREYHVDPQRVFMSGHSMGGHLSWRTALNLPERFAAIMPMSGGYATYAENDELLNAFNVKGWATWGVTEPYGIDVANETNRDVMLAAKLPWVFHELPGDHPLDDVEIGKMAKWAATLKRNPWPTTVVAKRTLLSWAQNEENQLWTGPSDTWNPDRPFRLDTMYWVRANAPPVTEGQAQKLLARNVGDNTIEVTAENTASFELLLHSSMVDFTKPVIVRVNGNVAFNGKVQPSIRTLLEHARHTGDRGLIYHAAVNIKVTGSKPVTLDMLAK